VILGFISEAKIEKIDIQGGAMGGGDYFFDIQQLKELATVTATGRGCLI